MSRRSKKNFSRQYLARMGALVFATCSTGGCRLSSSLPLHSSSSLSSVGFISPDPSPSAIGPPRVIEVGSPLSSGTFTAYAQVALTVRFSAPITLAGTATLDLNTVPPRAAACGGGPAPDSLSCTFVPAVGDRAAPLDYRSTLALHLATGATITSPSGTVDLTLPALGSASLAASKSLVIGPETVTLTPNLNHYFQELGPTAPPLNALDQNGFTRGTSYFARGDTLLIFDGDAQPDPGNAATTSYFILNGVWRRLGAALVEDHGADLVSRYFMVRTALNPASTTLVLPEGMHYWGSASDISARPWDTPVPARFGLSNGSAVGAEFLNNVAEKTLTFYRSGNFVAAQVTASIQGAGFSFKGGAFPGTGGTCHDTVTDFCTMVVDYLPTHLGVDTGSLVMQYHDGLEIHQQAIAIQGEGFYPDAANNLLVVYNSGNADSVAVKNYYLAHRPLIASANVIGVSTTAGEIIATADFEDQISGPVQAWIGAHPEKTILYIVLVYGLPSRTDASGNSVAFRLANAAPFTYQYMNTRFTHLTAPGTRALVTSLDTGSVASTEAYIDKLAAMYALMPEPHVVISARGTGRSGTTYHFDDAQCYAGITSGLSAKNAVLAENPAATVSYQDSAHILTASDVTGYQSWGYNGGLGGDYATNGLVTFTGNSGWYLIETFESFNGQRNGGGFQGDFIKWFAANAFGGTAYENTPVGSVNHVEEPYVGGVNGPTFFSLWERGYLFAEAAWSSANTPYLLVVGDPLVSR